MTSDQQVEIMLWLLTIWNFLLTLSLGEAWDRVRKLESTMQPPNQPETKV